MHRIIQYHEDVSFSKMYLKLQCSFKIILFIFESGERGRERGGQRIWSGLCADSSEPDSGLELTNYEIMTWAEVGRSTYRATQEPVKFAS